MTYHASYNDLLLLLILILIAYCTTYTIHKHKTRNKIDSITKISHFSKPFYEYSQDIK